MQIIIDQFAQQSGVSKKVAEQIARQFFDTIVDGLKSEGLVKINGLGTFKIVEVADRESVNVSNGERIIIPGYKKVGFVVDSSFVANKGGGVVKQEAPASEAVREETKPAQKTAIEETSPVLEAAKEEATPAAESTKEEPPLLEAVEESVFESTSYDKLFSADKSTQLPGVQNGAPSVAADNASTSGIVLSTPVIERIEIPSNELSNIDLLISTPESLAEVRDDYEKACKRAEETLKMAEEANAEMIRLKCLLHNLEANSEPEVVDLDDSPEGVSDDINNESHKDSQSLNEEDAVEADSNPTDNHDVADEPDPKDDVMVRYLNDDKDHTHDDEEEESAAESGKSYLLFWIAVPLLGVILGLCAIFAYRAWRDYSQECRLASTTQKVTVVDDSKSDAKLAKEKDKTAVAATHAKQEKNDSVNAKSASKPVKVAPEVKPSVAESSIQTDAKPKTVTPKVEAADKSTAKAKDSQTEATPTKPKSYVMKPGDTLTKLSLRFYGSKSHVSKIVKANKFPNPDNVPIGAEVILP